MPSDAWIFDFDNHYYEPEDAFTRHQDRRLGNRGIRWADVDGRRRLLVGGAVNSYVANPTFDPVSKPGALYDWYRGNPRQQSIREAFGELEPHSARVPRPGGPSRGDGPAGPRGDPALPDPGRRHRGCAQTRSRGMRRGVPRVQPLARRGLGILLPPPDSGGAVPPAAGPGGGRRRAAARRSTPVPPSSTCGTGRSPSPAGTGLRSIRPTTRFGRSPTRPASSLPRTPASTATTPWSRCGSRAGARARCSARPCGDRHQGAGRERLLRSRPLPPAL